MPDFAKPLRRQRQAGEGKIGLIIALVVVAFIVLVLVKYVPVRVQNAEYAKNMEEAARDYVVGDIRGLDNLYERLLHDAAEQDIPIAEDDIVITDTTKYVRIVTDYTVVIDMPWGDWPQEFHIEREVPRI